MELSWEIIDARDLNRRIGDPYVAINKARISLSPAACMLINGIYDLPFVEIRIAKDEDGNVKKIGLFFYENSSVNRMKVTRRKYRGEYTDGLNLNSKYLVRLIFSELEDQTIRFGVTKEGENALVVDTTKKL